MNDQIECENLFKLTKTSFLTVGGVVRKCLQILPLIKSSSQLQSLAIGDTRGVIYITRYQKTEPEILLKTQPYGNEIGQIQLVTSNGKESIFFAVNNSVYAISRNNTDRHKIEFDIAGDISAFQVIENQIWTSSSSYLSHYEFGESTTEKGTFDNEFKIISFFVSQVLGRSDPIVLIGSEDKKIKIVEKCTDILAVFATSGAPTCFCLVSMSLYDNSENNILYGTTTGSHGIVNITDRENCKILWEKDAEENLSEIVNIRVFDINYDGSNNIILIRTNGIVEIYSIGQNLGDINMICKHATGEHLTSMEIGKFKSEKFEILLSSLSGLVFSLTPDIIVGGGKQKLKTIDKKTLQKSIQEEEKECEALENVYKKNKEESDKGQNTAYNPIVKNSFKLDVRFTLFPKESVFQLLLDSEFPIEMVLLHCTKARLDVLEVKTKDVSMNVLEKETMDEETNSHTKFMATFKLKDACHSLEIILRTYEGITDNITATVIPLNKPKTAQLVQVPIKALSFHKKHEPEFEKDMGEVISFEDEKIVNVLIVDGMTSSEMNQILHLIIPNIPAILKGDTTKYVLRSTFLNTLVEISIGKNQSEIRSIFLSTLMILKEQITIEANVRKKDIQCKIVFKPLSVYKIIDILNPKIEQIFSLEMKYKMIQAFKELGDSVNLMDLPDQYREIMNLTEEITADYSKRTINLKYYKSLTIQLLSDIRKVVTVSDYNGKVNEIEKVFEDYSYEKMKGIFSLLNDI